MIVEYVRINITDNTDNIYIFFFFYNYNINRSVSDITVFMTYYMKVGGVKKKKKKDIQLCILLGDDMNN